MESVEGIILLADKYEKAFHGELPVDWDKDLDEYLAG